MGTSATKAKNKYASQNYDRITLLTAKGKKKEIKSYAESLGMSLNAYINTLIEKDMNG